MGGLGVAPQSDGRFTCRRPLADGSAPVPARCHQLETAGYFTAPAGRTRSCSPFGGVDVPVAQHWAVDVSYGFPVQRDRR
jgi:hypothetical protein